MIASDKQVVHMSVNVRVTFAGGLYSTHFFSVVKMMEMESYF